MKLKITTKVAAPWEKVMEGFNQELFLALNPPFPPVKLIKFDGCHKNDRVILQLNFIFFKQTWDSLITHDAKGSDFFEFVDEGVKLPFFLKTWHHTHRIQGKETGTDIIDQIEYTSGTLLTDILLYPILYGQFLYRSPVYKNIFR